MNRSDLEIGTEENGTEVAELLAALPRVEAPANFNFGVNARIAKGRPSGRTLFPFLKVAIPLSLLLVIGGLMFFYATMPGDDQVIVRSDSPGPSPLPVVRRDEPTIRSEVPNVPDSRVAAPWSQDCLRSATASMP